MEQRRFTGGFCQCNILEGKFHCVLVKSRPKDKTSAWKRDIPISRVLQIFHFIVLKNTTGSFGDNEEIFSGTNYRVYNLLNATVIAWIAVADPSVSRWFYVGTRRNRGDFIPKEKLWRVTDISTCMLHQYSRSSCVNNKELSEMVGNIVHRNDEGFWEWLAILFYLLLSLFIYYMPID